MEQFSSTGYFIVVTMHIDNQYWFYVIAIVVPFFSGTLMMVYASLVQLHKGAYAWILANFSFMLSFVIFASRDHLPEWFTLYLANIFLLLTIQLLLTGFLQFFGKAVPHLYMATMLGVYIVLQTVFAFVWPSMHARVLLFGFFSFIMYVWMMVWLFRMQAPGYRRLTRLLSGLMGVLSVGIVARSVIVITSPPQVVLSDDATRLFLIMGVLVNVGLSLLTMLLNATRQELELRALNSELEQANKASNQRLEQLAVINAIGHRTALADDASAILDDLLTSMVNDLGMEQAALCGIGSDGAVHVNHCKPGPRPTRQLQAALTAATPSIARSLAEATKLGLPPEQLPGGQGAGYVFPMLMGSNTPTMALYLSSTNPAALDENTVQSVDTIIRQVGVAAQKVDYHQTIHTQLELLTMLQSASQIILSSSELRSIFQQVVTEMHLRFHYPYIGIISLQQNALGFHAYYGYKETDFTITDGSYYGVLGRTIRTGSTEFLPDVTKDPEYVRTIPDITSEICVPIRRGQEVAGVILVESTAERPLTQQDLDLINALANPVGIAIENARLHQEVSNLALIDPVTGLRNRRAFNGDLAEELNRSRRYGQTFAVLIMDVDDFKSVNDTLGHPAGDACLAYVGALMRQVFRSTDVVARYGGDEFAAILSNISRDDAEALVLRFIEASQHAPQPPELKGKRVTFSIGIALYPQNGADVETLIRSADQAELEAKKHGKNKLCMPGEC